MRTSAASIKRKGGLQPQERPREGTRLRQAYDLLMTGEWVDLHGFWSSGVSKLIEIMQDYELEIRSRPNPDLPTAKQRPRRHQHQCIGVWSGDSLTSVEDVRIALEAQALRDPKGVQDAGPISQASARTS
jgi:hypothetical protein